MGTFEQAVAQFGVDMESMSNAISNAFSVLHFRGVYDEPENCEKPESGDCIKSGDDTLVYDGNAWLEMSDMQGSSAMYAPANCSTAMSAITYQDAINELSEKVDALSKRAIPRFHCISCGTQNFEYNGVATTPQCPNCGALMRRSDEPDTKEQSWGQLMSHYNDF